VYGTIHTISPYFTHIQRCTLFTVVSPSHKQSTTCRTMNCHFRSHLMQQFAASARTQSRPPLALFSFGNEGAAPRSPSRRSSVDRPFADTHRRPVSISSSSGAGPKRQLSSIPSSSSLRHRSLSSSVLQNDTLEEFPENDELDDSSHQKEVTHHVPPSPSAENFQQIISSRRTVSNFLSLPKPPPDHEHRKDQDGILSDYAHRQFLRDAIQRAVQCAMTAPNHKVTEPTTFHRIIAPSAASEKLLDIVYSVTLERLLSRKISGHDACRSEAMRKREKWSDIPAFLVATVRGMGDQCQSSSTSNNNPDGEIFEELPYVAPSTMRQLEDYAAACASIQNLLLSLHSEGLGSKWATGPVIRTRAFRDLIGCEEDDMVVGLIMVGWPKRLPRMPRRRRDLEGDILKDVQL